MRVTCPHCAESYPVEAGFSDADGKRLAAQFAGMDPVLGRAVLSYLRLFKPKTALRTSRAIKIVEDLMALVAPGTVCRDERSPMRRPATPAMWAAGIEQMLAMPGKLALPLANHHYLRAIVFGLADQADAEVERQREERARNGAHRPTLAPVEDRLANELAFLRQMHEYGQLSDDQYAARVGAAKESRGG
ncbi:MAG TPA: hypothetical protein VFN09_06605 [Rhodanobacteraceae bacterium]|nr:hypothetical protein [Rhodanobacteraceae bacterium]